MLAMSDTVRNPYLFARYPDWQPTFDMDGPQAVSARRQMLDRVVADRMLVRPIISPSPHAATWSGPRPVTSSCRSNGSRCSDWRECR